MHGEEQKIEFIFFKYRTSLSSCDTWILTNFIFKSIMHLKIKAIVSNRWTLQLDDEIKQTSIVWPWYSKFDEKLKKKNRTASSKKFFNIFLILLRTFEFRRFSWEKDTLDRRKRKLPRETSVFHRFSMSLLSRVDSAFPAPSAHTHTHERDRERERNTWSGN